MKNKINNQLLAEGFRHFSEMSYEEYLPFQEKIECSDLTYVVLYAYDETHPYLVKRVKNGLVIAGVDTEAQAFCVIIPLVDEELPGIYEETAALFQRNGIPMRLGTMSEKYMELLKDHPLTEQVSFEEARSDYVYEIAEYLNLEGGKNARKRRDLNKIRSAYDNIRVETIQDFRAEKGTILKVMDKWCEGYDCSKCMYGCERKVIERILNSDLINKLYGAIMYIGNRAEMFAIAQIIGDTCYLYFKKSVGRIQGSFYYFEYAFLQPIRNLKYVNFEEDMGLPGLREYKRRRHPVKMIDKYDIKIKGMSDSKLIRATRADEPFIIELWREAFGDSEEYIEAFLKFHRNTEADENRAFIWKEGGQGRMMLFALPAKIRQGGKIKNARYLYAIATKKEYRGKKYLKKMLPELKKIFGEACILFLVPENGVIPYYESLGLVKRQGLPGFVLERKGKMPPELKAAAMEGKSLHEASAGEFRGEASKIAEMEEMTQRKLTLDKITDAAEYCRLRNINLSGRDCVIWDAHEISWALCDISMAQGAAYVVECDYGKFLLAGVREETERGSCFRVIETTLPERVLEELYEQLLKELHCERMEQEALFYMIEAEKAEGEFYLSLALNE